MHVQLPHRVLVPCSAALLALAPTQQTPPADVVAWMKSTATPIVSLEPGADAADLAPLGKLVGKARIVALGEATHGSHEFFAFKRRVVEYLVREHGFTDFAMETDWTQALEVNAWVEHGVGDLDSSMKYLTGLWRTEEYRGLLQWMHDWNADPAHARKVHFHGADIGQAQATAFNLRAYLVRVEPDVAESVLPVIEGLVNAARVDDADIEGLITLFDEMREVFVEKSSEREWALYRQHAVVLSQSYRQRTKRGDEATSWRDRCMADNARWILRQGGPDARVVLSAHNGHVSRTGLAETEAGTLESIGRALTADARTVKGEDLSMLVVGSAFARGSFNAYGKGLTAFKVGDPVPESFEAALVAAGLERALLDLHAAPADGPVHAWLAAEHPVRFVGGAFDDAYVAQGADRQPSRIAEQFDVLFFVKESTPSRTLNTAR